MSASQPIQQATIEQYARQLYLTTMADQFSNLVEKAVQKKQSHLSYLEALLEAEVEERDRRAVLRRIKEALFPAVKTLEEFDFQSAPHLPVALTKKLSEGQYLERKEPAIFIVDPILRHSSHPCYMIETKRYLLVDFRPTGDRFEDLLVQVQRTLAN